MENKIYRAIYTNMVMKYNSLPALDCMMVKNNTGVITNLKLTVINTDIGLEDGLYEIKFLRDGHTVRNKHISFDDFPKNMTTLSNRAKLITLNGADLKKLYTACDFAGSDDLRPAMAHVYLNSEFGDTEVCGTDAHRLYNAKLSKKMNERTGVKGVMIHRNTVKLIKAFNPSHIVVLHNEKNWLFEFGSIIIAQYKEDVGRYPKYKDVIPTKDDEIGAVEGYRSIFIDILKDMKPLTGSINKVTMTTGEHESLLEVRNDDYSIHKQVKMMNKMTGESIKISFNLNFMLNALEKSKSRMFTLRYVANNRPMMIDDEYLVMPVMLTD